MYPRKAKLFLLKDRWVGVRLKVQGSRLKVQGSRLKVQGSRFKAQGSRFKVQDSRLKVQGSGVRSADYADYRRFNRQMKSKVGRPSVAAVSWPERRTRLGFGMKAPALLWFYAIDMKFYTNNPNNPVNPV